MSEIQADGADHSEDQEVEVISPSGELQIEMEVNYPDWYIKNREDLDAFLTLSQEERGDLVGEASGIFGTVLSSLSMEGQKALINSGNSFAAANFATLKDRYSDMGATDFILMLLGVSVECLGVQQMKINQAKKQ